MVKTNPDLTITGIYITGYASPEGTVEYNLKLSKNRAEALAAYAQKDTEVDASLWHVTGVGEVNNVSAILCLPRFTSVC